jgi:hypothetical protein
MKSPNAPEADTPRAWRPWANKRGNIALITAFMMIPLTFALGMAYDLTMAQSRKDQINGMADVAALGAVTPTMMTGTWASSQTQALNLFKGQISTVSGVTYNVNNISVTGSDNTAVTPIVRTITVNYTAASTNIFATLLGMPSFPISGTSTATSSISPNINFYLLLDTSPSMMIVTTSSIATMQANTTAQQPNSTPAGCAFACHESSPTSADTTGNPNGEDNYTLARNLGLTLRTDLVTNATQNLMTTAYNTALQNNATYQAAIYTIDVNFTKVLGLTSLNSSASVSTASTAAGGVTPLEVCNNNNVTCGNGNNDEDTNLDSGLSSINTAMPNPGTGAASSTPQEVLFIVTDGLNDNSVSGNRSYTPIDSSNAGLCTAIKNRNIRIAVLYTTYSPLDNGGTSGSTWYDQHVASVQPNIATAAQNCASPGLFYEVDNDADISTALTNLFQRAVATARLTQ